MNINIEKEYKILLSETNFFKLLSFYPEAIFKEQINTYYDTPDMAIRNAHGAMRIRKTDIFLFTLKMQSDQGLIEFELPLLENSATALQKKEILDVLFDYNIHGPFKRITSLTTKRAMIITDDAELCFDINYYNTHIDYEVEYEYRRAHDGRSVFNHILNQIDLQYAYNCDSKIKRALDSLK